ncbi:unnamed protein product [Closterium sp. Yama58-4]|nr:unnamed protein product [Closterium sp. Yama58-4]
MHHVDLARRCFTRFGIRLDRSTIGRVLKGSERWAATTTNNNIVRVRGGAHSELERAMARWIANAGTLATIHDHVVTMARGMVLPATFRCSIGRVRRALRRQGVRCLSAVGEAADQDMAAVRTTREKLPQLLMHRSVRARDVYNFDETALYISVLPRKTYGNGRVAGRKVPKDRLTVGFLVNVDGSHSFRPLVISKAKCPHDFRPDYDLDEVCYWRNTAKGWMTIPMDNASSHVLKSKEAETEDLFGFRTQNLSTVRIVYLPPNTTAFTQPLDQGIIATAKARYRAHWLSTFTALWSADGAMAAMARYKPNLRNVLAWLCDAWMNIERHTIQWCWWRTECLPNAWAMELEHVGNGGNGAGNIELEEADPLATEPPSASAAEMWEAPASMQAVYDDGNPACREARRYARAAGEMLIGYARATDITPRDLCALFDICNPIIRARMERASSALNLKSTPPPAMPLGATPQAENPRRRGRVLPAWTTEPTPEWVTLALQAARRQQLIDAGAPAVMGGYLDAAEWMRLFDTSCLDIGWRRKKLNASCDPWPYLFPWRALEPGETILSDEFLATASGGGNRGALLAPAGATLAEAVATAGGATASPADVSIKDGVTGVTDTLLAADGSRFVRLTSAFSASPISNDSSGDRNSSSAFGGPAVLQALCELKPAAPTSNDSQQAQQQQSPRQLSLSFFARASLCAKGGGGAEGEAERLLTVLLLAVPLNTSAAAVAGGGAGGGAAEQVWGEWRVGVPCGGSSASLSGALPCTTTATTTTTTTTTATTSSADPSPLNSFSHWPLSSAHPLLTAGSARRNRASLSLTTLSDLNSASLALHPAPFALLAPATPASPCRPFSFSTSFAFRISSPNAAGLGGEGLAFVMLPSPTLGLPGPSLGYGRLLLPPGSTTGADNSNDVSSQVHVISGTCHLSYVSSEVRTCHLRYVSCHLSYVSSLAVRLLSAGFFIASHPPDLLCLSCISHSYSATLLFCLSAATPPSHTRYPPSHTRYPQQQRSLAVEFDTSSSPEFLDRPDHHVGVNLHGTMLSLASAPVHPVGIPSLNAGSSAPPATVCGIHSGHRQGGRAGPGARGAGVDLPSGGG